MELFESFSIGQTRAAKNKKKANYKKTSDGVNPCGKKKLTTKDCESIRKMSSQFKTQREIALAHGITIDLVRKVLRKEYVPDE